MVLGHHVHAHAPCTLCILITLYLQLYLHKSYVHETRQGSFLWQKTNTHKNQIILSKRFFPVMIFFHLWVLQLILHRATIRLLFLVKEKELPILTFLIFICKRWNSWLHLTIEFCYKKKILPSNYFFSKELSFLRNNINLFTNLSLVQDDLQSDIKFI